MLRILLIAGLLLPLPLVGQAVSKDEVVQAASDIQKAVEGTDQLRLKVNRYCRITITHEPEEALLKVVSAHILSQKYNIPASEMLYVIKASVATEGQLLLWSGDCAEVSARTDDVDALRLAKQIQDHFSALHKASECFWELLARQIAAEEAKTIQEQ